MRNSVFQVYVLIDQQLILFVSFLLQYPATNSKRLNTSLEIRCKIQNAAYKTATEQTIKYRKKAKMIKIQCIRLFKIAHNIYGNSNDN